MATIRISLPAHLEAFVDAEAQATGQASAAEYINLLIHRAHLQKRRKQVDELLLEGLNSGPATPMTPQDWQETEREGLARLAKEKKSAARNQNKPRGEKRPA